MGKFRKKTSASGPGPSKVDPPETPKFHGSPAHLWKADNIQNTTMILHLGTHKVGVSLLQPKTGRIISLRTDQRVTADNVFDQYCFPFRIALVKDRVFASGFFAQEFTEQLGKVGCSHKIINWELGNYLMRGVTHALPEEIQHSEGKKVETRLELLLALYFQDLLIKIHKRKWNPCQEGFITIDTSKIIVSVPLWFSSVSRQRLLSTADLLGTQFEIINECTAAAYIFHRLSLPVVPQWKKRIEKQLLVFSENSGNIDVALYTASGKELKMEVCMGNMYLYRVDPQTPGDHGQKYKQRYNENRNCDQARRGLIRGLLGELEHRLPEHLREALGQPLKIIVQGEDPTWEKIIIEEMEGSSTFSSRKAEPTQPESSAGPRSCFWFDLDYTRILDDLCGPNVKDLYPYTLMAKHYIGRHFTEYQCKVNRHLRELELDYSLDNVQFYEKYSTGQELPLSQIMFPLAYQSRPGRVVIRLEWDQLLKIYKFFGVYGPDGKQKKEEGTHFVWSTTKLPEELVMSLWEACETAWNYKRTYTAKLDALVSKCKKVDGKVDKVEKDWEAESHQEINEMVERNKHLFVLETLDDLLEAETLINESLDALIKLNNDLTLYKNL